MLTHHTRAAMAALLLVLLSSCGSRVKENFTAPVQEISVDQLQQWMSAGDHLTLIDVREDDEWRAGHAAAAIHLARWTLPERIAAVEPDKSARVVLYCRSGVRSLAAAAVLQKMGYTNVFSLAGGFQAYQRAGLPAA